MCPSPPFFVFQPCCKARGQRRAPLFARSITCLEEPRIFRLEVTTGKYIKFRGTSIVGQVRFVTAFQLKVPVLQCGRSELDCFLLEAPRHGFPIAMLV